MHNMKRIFLSILLGLGSFWSIAQQTDAQNTSTFDVIRNATAPSSVTRQIVAGAYDVLNNSKASRVEVYTATGTNSYAVTVPWVTAYTKGLQIPILFTNANTAAVTVNVNGLGNVSVKKLSTTALSSGDIPAGQIVSLYHDGTNFQVFVGSGGGSGSVTLTGDVTGTGTGTIATTVHSWDYSALSAHGTLAGTELLGIEQIGVNVYSSLNDLAAYASLCSTSDINGNYTFLVTDAEPRTTILRQISGSASTLTIPSGVFSKDDAFYVDWYGVGTPTFVAGGGMTIRNNTGNLAMSGIHTYSFVKFYSSSECTLMNGIAGGGDFHGPGSSTTNDIVVFADGTGKTGSDSGTKISDLLAVTAKAGASDITTGTNDTKYTTSLGLAGSNLIDQSGAKIYAASSGTDTYTATLSPAITAYATGQTVRIKFGNANTTAATINLNSLGAKSIKKVTSSGSSVALVANDIQAGHMGELIYDGTNFQLINPIPPTAGGTKYYVIPILFLQVSFADATTRYFGGLSVQPSATEGVQSQVHIPIAGTITGVELHTWSSVAGTNESWTMYLRLNNTTDITIATLSDTNATKDFSNLALSQAVIVGDVIEGKTITPTWATNPTLTSGWGLVVISY